MRIHHYEGICNTPAHPIALRGYAELIEKGLADNIASLSWEDNAITAEIAGKAVGVLLWAHQKWTKTIVIKIGYIEKRYRRKGIYEKLFNEMVKKATTLDVHYIDGATSINNIPMRSFAKKQGRIEYAVCLRYFIKSKKRMG